MGQINASEKNHVLKPEEKRENMEITDIFT